MERFLEICKTDRVPVVEPCVGMSLVLAEQLQAEGPDAHWVLLDSSRKAAARCSLWWSHVPRYGDQRVGVIGHFAASDAPSADELLAHAVAQLCGRNCTLAIGPMDGNTWRRYRFVVERGVESPFFLEPDNPDAWPQYFATAGFGPIANYTSALNKDLTVPDPRIRSIGERVKDMGIKVRQADATRMEDELRRVYAVSLASFQRNFLYTPLPEADFLAQYKKVLALVRPELVLIAEREGQPVGFLFAIPDVLRQQRHEPNDTIIIKTVAVVPDCADFGLGTLLVGKVEQTASGLGFKRAIHALMHQSNRSRAISSHSASTMRRYALFARPLTT